MKQGIVYVIFGDQSDSHSRVHKILREVDRAAEWREQLSAPIAYVFGDDNFRTVTEQGFAARLIDQRPLVVSPSNQQQTRPAWIHKPLGWAAALSEFDEIVALDWDIRPAGSIEPAGLFRRLGMKSFIQANLFQYRRIMAPYRKKMPGSIANPPIRAIPSAAFVYLRGGDGRHAVQRVLELMEQFPQLTEEQAMARFIDELYGGWKGLENWWQHHEPFCCRIRKGREAVSAGGQIKRDKEHLFLY